MINVNQITAQLAKMPDASLQKYAAMNKNDPYIVALAVAESNRRKELRQAAQGAQGMQPQPKVVDTAVQGMAAPMPEEMGIARLPAGDMNFADGGIVAFADGGDVEHYQYGGTTQEARNPYAFLNPGDFFGGISRIFSEGIDPVEAEKRRQAELRKMQAPAEETVGTPEFAAAQQALRAKAATEGRVLPGDQTPPPPPPPAPAAAPRAPGVAAPSFAGLDVAKMLEDATRKARDEKNPFAEDVKKLGEERETAARENLKGLEAIQEKFADIYKGRRERLDKREGETGKMKDQALGLALLQAGATMMSTRGNLGTAIGKGAAVGAEQFSKGMEKVQAAREKLADARDRLDDLEAQRGEMSARERLKGESDVRNAGIAARESMIRANMDWYNVSYDRATKMVDNQIKVGIAQLEQQGATARTNAQVAAANRTPADIQMVERIMAERKIPFTEALALYQGTKQEPRTNESLLKAWAANPALQLQYPNPQDYIRMLQGSPGAGGAGQLNPSDRALIEKYSR